MQTYEQFAKKHGVKFESQPREFRGDGLMTDCPNHWSCKLTCGMNEYEFWFSGGSAVRSIELDNVLSCMASDCAGTEDRTFEDWAAEYGYDTDSRSAEKIFDACCKQYTELLALFGKDVLEELLYQTNEDGDE